MGRTNEAGRAGEGAGDGGRAVGTGRGAGDVGGVWGPGKPHGETRHVSGLPPELCGGQGGLHRILSKRKLSHAKMEKQRLNSFENPVIFKNNQLID